MGVTGMSYRAASPSRRRASECGRWGGTGGLRLGPPFPAFPLNLGAAKLSTVDSRQEGGGGQAEGIVAGN